MERIYVTVRARPLSAEDAKSSPWRISGNSISIPNQPAKFEFDRIFGEECKTAEVYGAKMKEIVSSAVRGFNGTVFAYGQTNSGKTHTMRGTGSELGIIPLSVHDLFQSIRETLDREFLVRMSYMEIYNEEINDLLVPEHRKLQIHESLDRGIFVAGLREEIVTSPEQVLDLMHFGESHRHIGETNMNVYSSRSHTIFRMIIESRERNDDDDCGDSCDAVRVSVLNLVDLAGSERAAKTGAEGVRLKEGSHINKSLMTLGTVIKKLSEGAESQGGHVPYRDSKLTRILQPALGGNANTAIICNITLAQIHADETKSTLQFASRALRVTNCACINEILTDAALLKRQKKEIEELRARLQGSHSEHWEKEILNLRNTLLQSELEKERIALELEEEKKAKAQRERRLLEQAEKIANLSSMVLYSKRDEDTSFNQKKRRNTWCPGPLLRQASHDVTTTPNRIAANTKPDITELGRTPALPFAELVQENVLVRADIRNSCVVNPVEKNESFGDFSLPDAHALLHVTNRRKGHFKNTRVLKDNNVEKTREEMVCEYPGITANECSVPELNQNMYHGCNSLTMRESEAILVIKQLEDQIKLLEMEKASMQENLDSVMTLATEQNTTFRERYNELQKELLDAREDAKLAKEHLCCMESVINFDEMTLSDDLKREMQEIALEFHSCRETTDNVLLMFKDLFENYSGLSEVLMELKASASQDMKQMNLIVDMKNSIIRAIHKKVTEHEIEKGQMNKVANDNAKKIQELKFELENSKKLLVEQSSQYDLEKDQLFHEMLTLQKELSYLSSSSLAKEKETLRKDHEKAKTKLRETESKLKNAIQDKSKLESEKAQMERELKRLHGQKAHLERDISKHESFTDRRRDSKPLDSKWMKGHTGMTELKFQMDHQKLEVFAFEMEAEIASLKEELLATMEEKQEALHRLEAVDPELQDLASKLNTSNSELKLLKEEMAATILRLNDSQTSCKKLEDSVTSILKEKEEMALELTDALLELEAEKSNHSDMERASLGLTEKAEAFSYEVSILTKELVEVKSELESCQEQCKVLKERLSSSEEATSYQNYICLPGSSGNTHLKDCAQQHEIDLLRCEEESKTKSGILSSQHDKAYEEVRNLQKQLDVLLHERDGLLLQLESLKNNSNQTLKGEILEATKERDAILVENEELKRTVADVEITKQTVDKMLSLAKSDREVLSSRISIMETEMHEERLNNNKEKTKLRMKLLFTQAKLDAYRGRYTEIVDEMRLMNRKFEEASTMLKDQLASYGKEILRLKKELSSKN